MITKTMTLAEALRVDRTIAPIFMSYGMHCLGCPHATAESIEQACAVHGVDVDELVSKLNAHLDGKK
ncbi:MAG: DUF1858 domain-containing protein [Christensenellales bacterium]|jgi:hybrid cluster-associated redox disulfide protein